MTSLEVAAYLPAVFRRAAETDATLQALLSVMEGCLHPVEERLDRLDSVFDVLGTDDRFIPLLAGWVDLDWLANAPGLPVGRLRLLVGESHALARDRGTRAGLIRFLEIATGVRGFTIDESAPDLAPFTIRVHVPAAAADRMALVRLIVETEKPAFLTSDVVTP